MSADHRLRSGTDDIAPLHWQGGPIDCAACPHAALAALPQPQGCQPGHACMQDAYALRIVRFFRWHPELAVQSLTHPYFEVRAIAARHASVFHLPALVNDPDETVRMQVALRLPVTQLAPLAHDPHREVRLRVAHRLSPIGLAALLDDPDYGVRELVARRLPLALLLSLKHDPDRTVRMRVAQRLEMPALLSMANDRESEVRRVVAERLPVDLLAHLVHDRDWRVRWEVARRAPLAVALTLANDPDPEVCAQLAERQERAEPTAPVALFAPAQRTHPPHPHTGAPHG